MASSCTASVSRGRGSQYDAALLVVLCAALVQHAFCQSTNIDGVPLPPWFGNAAAGAMIGVGLFQVVLGYKFFRVTLFLLGFFAAGLAVFFPAWDNIADPNGFYYAMAMGLLAGILVGGLGAWMPRIGVFLVGAMLGLITAFILNMTVLYKISNGNPTNTLIAAAVVLGLGLGVLATFMMRPVVVVSTSVIGAYGVIRGIGSFVGNFPNEFQLKDQIINGQSLPVEVYGYFGGVLGIAVIGIVIQFKYTAKKKKESEKDEWEQEFEESEISLEALRGEGDNNYVVPDTRFGAKVVYR